MPLMADYLCAQGPQLYFILRLIIQNGDPQILKFRVCWKIEGVEGLFIDRTLTGMSFETGIEIFGIEQEFQKLLSDASQPVA